MKKPDNFEQMVAQLFFGTPFGKPYGAIQNLDVPLEATARDTINMLRRYHARVCRFVRGDKWCNATTLVQAAHNQACDNLLAQLAKLKKGTR